MNFLKNEPVIVTTVLVVVLSALLLAATKYALGRNLEWTEVMGIWTAVSGIGAMSARTRVTPNAKCDGGDQGGSAPYRKPGQVPPPPADGPIAIAKRSFGHLLPARWKAVIAVPAIAVVWSCAMILVFGACTSTQANQDITIGGVVCEAIIQVSDPTIAPLCATAEEVAQAVASLIEDARKTNPAAGGATAVMTPNALRDKILQLRAAKAAKVK